MLPETIATPRLVLRRPRLSDSEAIFSRYAQDPEVTRNLTWRPHRSLEDTRAFLERSDFGWSTGSDHPYLAWQGGELAGATGLTPVGPGTLRTGYLVARDLWGQGYAGEMLQAMVRTAFSRPEVHCVEALVEPAHEASIRVLRRQGFRSDPGPPVMGLHPNLGDRPRPLARYLLLRQG